PAHASNKAPIGHPNPALRASSNAARFALEKWNNRRPDMVLKPLGALSNQFRGGLGHFRHALEWEWCLEGESRGFDEPRQYGGTGVEYRPAAQVVPAPEIEHGLGTGPTAQDAGQPSAIAKLGQKCLGRELRCPLEDNGVVWRPFWPAFCQR